MKSAAREKSPAGAANGLKQVRAENGLMKATKYGRRRTRWSAFETGVAGAGAL